MSEPVAAAETRLEGLSASSLDSYLRAIGLLRVTERIGTHIRTRWDEDGTFVVVGETEPLIQQVADAAAAPLAIFSPVQSPWRGPEGDKDHAALRNTLDDSLLDWIDACMVIRPVEEKHENNPLLGQGGDFGNSRVAPAHAVAIEKLVKANAETARAGLLASLHADPLAPKALTKLRVTKKVLGAYQSGRGTGPGASREDLAATNQKAGVNAWDLLLATEGLLAFAGISSRRPGGRGATASFPLMTRARAVGLDTANRDSLREETATELLAPLWSAVARSDVVLHRLGAFRLRVGSRPASDTVEAIVAQTGVRGDEVGFDRLERYALVKASDPRFSYAVRRGTAVARGSDLAATVVSSRMLNFLRQSSGMTASNPPRSLMLSRRRLEETLAAVGSDRESAVQMLVALGDYERGVVRAVDSARLPNIRWPWCGGQWLPALYRTMRASGTAAALSLARAWTVTDPNAGPMTLGRISLLGWTVADHRWRPSPDSTSEPERHPVSLLPLARTFVDEIRRRETWGFAPNSEASLRAIVDLIGGCARPDAIVRATLAAARLEPPRIAPRSSSTAERPSFDDGNAQDDPKPAAEEAPDRAEDNAPDPFVLGIGRSLALVLAAPLAGEGIENGPSLRRRTSLASLATAGDTAGLVRAAQRMAATAELKTDADPSGLSGLDPGGLSLALLCPLGSVGHDALVSVLRPGDDSSNNSSNRGDAR